MNAETGRLLVSTQGSAVGWEPISIEIGEQAFKLVPP